MFKKLLIVSPILNIAYLEKDFVVCVDSWIDGLGGVLMKEGYDILYDLRKLKKNEKNYVTHDWELVAIIHALKM